VFGRCAPYPGSMHIMRAMRRTTPAPCRAASIVVALLLAGCSGTTASTGRATPRTHDPRSTTTVTTASVPPGTNRRADDKTAAPLPAPAALSPTSALSVPGQGEWLAAGRPVDGVPAVYETTLTPPGGSEPAGIAWMDTHLLSARLYSGSASPGGGPYRYSAPIGPAEAPTLEVAFNGGFMMDSAGGGYLTEGRVVVPLVIGAASLVIRSDGTVDVGAWGSDVVMSPDVVAVRQNLVPLVEAGRPTPPASGPDWQAWGNTCGAASCAHSVPGVEQQWRSGVGVTTDGAVVYATGPALTPLQLALLLSDAGAVRAMELDINPSWTVLVTYDPVVPGAAAAPDNGTRLLAGTVQGPATFFEPWWARDFVTLSARPPAG